MTHSLNITTIEPGKELVTLLARDNETGQTTICQHMSSAILTTAHAELICYAANLIHHFGHSVTYTVSRVQPMEMAEMNERMLEELQKFGVTSSM
jgi:hypothetical protein